MAYNQVIFVKQWTTFRANIKDADVVMKIGHGRCVFDPGVISLSTKS